MRCLAISHNCLTTAHMCLPCSSSGWVGPCILCTLTIRLIVVLLTFFLGMVSMALVQWELVLFWGMGVEFRGKIILHYSGEVQWERNFTTGIEFWGYVLSYLLGASASGLVVAQWVFRFGGAGSFPGGIHICLAVNVLLGTLPWGWGVGAVWDSWSHADVVFIFCLLLVVFLFFVVWFFRGRGVRGVCLRYGGMRGLFVGGLGGGPGFCV